MNPRPFGGPFPVSQFGPTPGGQQHGSELSVNLPDRDSALISGHNLDIDARQQVSGCHLESVSIHHTEATHERGKDEARNDVLDNLTQQQVAELQPEPVNTNLKQRRLGLSRIRETIRETGAVEPAQSTPTTYGNFSHLVKGQKATVGGFFHM